jgi:hypothetical protein
MVSTSRSARKKIWAVSTIPTGTTLMKIRLILRAKTWKTTSSKLEVRRRTPVKLAWWLEGLTEQALVSTSHHLKM